MRKKFRQLSLQAKMSSIFVLANLVVFAVTVILLLGINSMSSEIDKVYQGNLRLNEVSDALMAVQDSMTDYLNSKTSDSLEEFYRNEQTYSQLVQDMSDGVTGATFQRMERSIRHMSEEYLDLVSQTIEAKRGRNVEKYRVRYENATQMYEYINTYIYSLNNEQFRSNSENYSRLSAAFRNFEMVSVIALSIVIVVSVFIVVKLTGEIISPLKDLAVTADEVAGGNFDTELLQVQSEDEIGVVTGAFNRDAYQYQTVSGKPAREHGNPAFINGKRAFDGGTLKGCTAKVSAGADQSPLLIQYVKCGSTAGHDGRRRPDL